MLYKFELAKGTIELIKNGTFTNAYSYTAAFWEAIIWTNGLNQAGQSPDSLTHHLYLSTYYSLEEVTGFSVDNVYRRGVYNDSATTSVQGASVFAGIWTRQNNVLEAGASYDVEFRVRYFQDDSVALGALLPAVVELRVGSTGGVLQATATGTFTATLTQGGDNSVYINMYACRAMVDFVSVKSTVPPAFVEVPEPVNLKDIDITIEPDTVLGGVFKKFIGEATFNKEGYSIIKSSLDDFGPEAFLLCNIYRRCSDYDPWELEFEGIIFMDDYEEDLQNCNITLTIESNDLFGKIIRNKDALMNVYDTYSINGIFLGATPVYAVSLNDSGFVSIGNFPYWYFHDLLKLAVRWISDDELDFDAECLGGSDQGYGADGDYSAMVVTTGYELRGYSGREAFVSFAQLWKSALACFGVYAKIVDVAGTPTFTVNKFEDNYNTASPSIEFTFVKNIHREIARDLRYKTARIGFEEFEKESQSDGEAFGQMNLVFKNDNSSGGSKELLSYVIGSGELILQKTAESSSDALRFDFDESLYFAELTSHGVYQTKAVASAPPFNQGIGFVEPNNYLIMPWRMYSRHRRYIYDSASLAKFAGNLYGSLLVQGHYNDFRSNGTNLFVTWVKLAPGTSSDLYFLFSYEFENKITFDDINTIISLQENRIGISQTGADFTYGYIKSIKLNLMSNNGKILIIGES